LNKPFILDSSDAVDGDALGNLLVVAVVVDSLDKEVDIELSAPTDVRFEI
jgi:hypothetical protein